MEDSEKPKKRSPLGRLGGILIIGGVGVVYQAGKTSRFYTGLQEPNAAGWASTLGVLMILGGIGLGIAALARMSD